MLPSINGTVSAQFTVTGEPGFTYAITLPTDFILMIQVGLNDCFFTRTLLQQVL
jgi:hypothetical protein